MTVAWFPAAVRSVAARMKRARVLTYAAAGVTPADAVAYIRTRWDQITVE